MNRSELISLSVGVAIGILLRRGGTEKFVIPPLRKGKEWLESGIIGVGREEPAPPPMTSAPSSRGSVDYSEGIAPSPVIVIVPRTQPGGNIVLDPVDDDTLCRDTQECIDRYGPNWQCLNGRCVEVVPFQDDIPMDPELRAMFPHITSPMNITL